MRRLTFLTFSLMTVPLVATVLFAHEGHKKEHDHPSPHKSFSLKSGAAVYKQYCAECHGQTGHNRGPFPAYMDPVPTNFLDRGYMVMKSRVDLYESVRDGRPDTRMKAWKERLSDEEMWDAVAWIEHLFTHAADKH